MIRMVSLTLSLLFSASAGASALYCVSGQMTDAGTGRVLESFYSTEACQATVKVMKKGLYCASGQLKTIEGNVLESFYSTDACFSALEQMR